MEVKEILSKIDHTNLKQGLTEAELVKLLDEAIKFETFSVCVQPSNVKFCKNYLKDTKVKVCTVVGFPLGENTSLAKALEAKNAYDEGADEIDMVISNSMVKRKEFDKILDEINLVVSHAPNCLHKVIIETCLLTKEEIKAVTEIVCNSHADYVKTSTGFCGQGATVENVAIMAGISKGRKKIKAAGGISGAADAIAMIDAGASRLGTSKGGLIAKELLSGVKGKDEEGTY